MEISQSACVLLRSIEDHFDGEFVLLTKGELSSLKTGIIFVNGIIKEEVFCYYAPM